MLCGWNQWRISNALDEGKSLPASVKKHLLVCPKCRSFFKAALQVEEALLDPTLRISFNKTDNRIDRMAEAAMSNIPSPPKTQPIWKRYAAMAMAAGLIIAASIMIPRIRKAPNPNIFGSNDPVVALQSIMNDLRPTVTVLPIPSSPTTLPSYLASPYQRELNQLRQDTDSAVKFVASCAGIDLSNKRVIPEVNFHR
jgi:hypothetical protein